VQTAGQWVPAAPDMPFFTLAWAVVLRTAPSQRRLLRNEAAKPVPDGIFAGQNAIVSPAHSQPRPLFAPAS
jgi:hypothetical protein